MGGVRRHELRFGLLGPLVIYEVEAGSYEVEAGSYDVEAGAHDTAGRRSGDPRRGAAAGPGPARAVVPLRSPKVRALLAALLLESGRVVSVASLEDALWGGAPPRSARASLHNHVARLRRLLDDPGRLSAVPPGYVLRVDEGELDIDVFVARVAAARAAHAGRDRERTLRECAGALALWRGTPLSGLPAEVGGYALVQRLEEARLLLLEWRHDAELATPGVRRDALLPELAALAAEYPLREAFHRQLMLALHRTGRQAEALAVHRDLRARLIEELGVEPGRAVREAHAEVLRGPNPEGPAPADGENTPQGPPAPDDECRTGGAGGNPHPAEGRVPTHAPAPAQAPPPAQAPAPPPAQLPPPPATFTGRSPEAQAIHDTLLNRRSHPVVISGMPGIGKSALALHTAHTLTERFPDGQLYINLHGATPGMPPLTPTQALTALLRDLGTDPRAIPEHPDAAAALLRSLLAPTRTLLLLDDAANAAQVRPLLPAGPGCAVIVTSRSPLTALDGARRFPLTPLSDEGSAALLRAVSGRTGLDAAHPLVALTGRLPLALRVVAARLAARRALTPDVLAEQLAATEGRLRHLEYDDLSVRRSLAVAHDALAASDREPDRDAALALRRIGTLDLPAYGAPLLARLTGTDEHRAEAALDRLVDVALLEETAYGRYTPHDLVRDFARELAAADADAAPDAAADVHAGNGFNGVETALRWYAAVAERTLTAIVEPGLDRDDRRTPTAAQPPRHAAEVATVPPFTSPEAAFAWADLELENIIALVERHEGDEDAGPAHLSTLIRLLFPCLHRSGRVAEMEVLGRTGLRLARRLGDPAAEAYALGDLAGLHFLTGRQNEALHLNDRALEIWRRLGVVSWMRRGLNNRGLLLEGLGRHAESDQALRQSLEYSRQLNDPYGEAVTRSHLGNLYEHTDPRAAIEQHRRSLAIGDAIGNVIVQHTAHCNIGYAHLALDEPAAAATHFEQSRRILGGHGDWHGESQTRLGLVRALRLLGRTTGADHECAELLTRADARADRYMGGLARHQHGLLLRERGRVQEAYEAWRTALEALDGTDEKAVVAELGELLADEGRR